MVLVYKKLCLAFWNPCCFAFKISERFHPAYLVGI